MTVIIYLALIFAGSVHLTCRYRAKDIRSAVLRETLIPWLNNTVSKKVYTCMAHENMITLFIPQNNRENLPEDYIADILDTLPGKQKARFSGGLWAEVDSIIYNKFDGSIIVKACGLPEHFDCYAAWQDSRLNIAFVKIGWLGDVIYILGDYGVFNKITQSFNAELQARGLLDCHDKMGFPVYCDPARGERIQEITGGLRLTTLLKPEIIYLDTS
jgi:hypothetical protein